MIDNSLCFNVTYSSIRPGGHHSSREKKKHFLVGPTMRAASHQCVIVVVPLRRQLADSRQKINQHGKYLNERVALNRLPKAPCQRCCLAMQRRRVPCARRPLQRQSRRALRFPPSRRRPRSLHACTLAPPQLRLGRRSSCSQRRPRARGRSMSSRSPSRRRRIESRIRQERTAGAPCRSPSSCGKASRERSSVNC